MTPTLLVVGLVLATIFAVSVVSFRVGRSRGFSEIFRIRIEAAQARRRMHELTRQAFTAMSEAAESVPRRQPNRPEHQQP